MINLDDIAKGGIAEGGIVEDMVFPRGVSNDGARRDREADWLIVV